MSARSANLRAILADDEDVRKTVFEMVTTMESIDKEEVRGFRLASQLDPGAPQFMSDSNPKLIELEIQPYQKLRELISRSTHDKPLSLPKEALSVDEISLRGVCYTTSRSSKFRSSRIIFQLPGAPTPKAHSYRAGAIRDIFRYSYHCGEEERHAFYLSVWEYLRHDHTQDPYIKFGFAGGFLCEAQPAQFHILELSQVVSHFGLTKMKGKYASAVHVMPVDRVCEEHLQFNHC